MRRRFFELHDDVYVPRRWELGDLMDARGRILDGDNFVQGLPLDFDGSLRVTLRRYGLALDFSHLVGSPVPVVSEKVLELFNRWAPNDFQVVPVRIDTRTELYFLLNVRRLVKCIDDKRSAEVQYWTPEDGQPAKVGRYSAVHGLRVDTDLIPSEVKVFRPWGWIWPMIVSSELRTALLRSGATGLWFTPV